MRIPIAPAFCENELWKLRNATLSTATPSVRKRLNSIRGNLMLAQEFLQLIGVEIREHLVTRDEGRDIGLLRKLLHFFVGFSIFADIDRGGVVSARFEIFFLINAP